MSPSLESILQHPSIWRGNQPAQASEAALPTGFAALDAVLPGGGWPRGALTELLIARHGIGELQLLMPALARLSITDGWLAWVAPPYVPYAPALAAAGVDLKRLLIAKPTRPDDAWWAAEQALRSGSCSALLAWLRGADERRMRRLQLAAETGCAWGVLLRHARAAETRSPAALRLLLEPAHEGLAVHVLKRRGGPVSQPVIVALWQADEIRWPKRQASVLSMAQS
ncbi:MAG: translesion DNA synthesis-associated protein ImuA [Tepidimonas sp.]|uniref:translesion DNA synthesis-associated protein ImuA n=1 Tax=Tepidimonas sp. TaxID=2002775 RepID=UPI00259E7DC8|nr:translesion DNA synthesis-associated protein ImuA [Tepidimonas sp.]MDM7456684.1 translesion DNA synthesis-associated protein ImuA [Tepidimonas sp.]